MLDFTNTGINRELELNRRQNSMVRGSSQAQVMGKSTWYLVLPALTRFEPDLDVPPFPQAKGEQVVVSGRLV